MLDYLKSDHKCTSKFTRMDAFLSHESDLIVHYYLGFFIERVKNIMWNGNVHTCAYHHSEMYYIVLEKTSKLI